MINIRLLKPRHFLLILVICHAFVSRLSAQTTRFVSTTGVNNNPSTATSWATSTTDLQGAINASSPGDQVWVAQGIYKPIVVTGAASRTASFSMKNEVAVYGGFSGTEQALSERPGRNPATGQPGSSTLSGETGNPSDLADNCYHVIYNSGELSDKTILDGFVITSGTGNGTNGNTAYGGGLYLSAVYPVTSTPTIRNCLFTGNYATYGGAVYNLATAAVLNGTGGTASPVFSNCSFINNTSKYEGGAIYTAAYERSAKTNPTFTQCTFLYNSSDAGGAIANVSLSSNSIANPTLISCIFHYNTSFRGAAVYNNSGYKATGKPVLTNCSFFNNTTNGSRTAAFYNESYQGDSSPSFTNCTFYSNEGAVYNYHNYATKLEAVLTNCVLFQNAGSKTFSNVYGGSVKLNYSLIDSIATGYTATNSLTTTVSPFLNSVSTLLSPCSPAINSGLNTATGLTGIATDLAGNPRIIQQQVDMGAYETETNSAIRHRRLYVNAAATGSNSGLDWENAFTDLQSALFYPCIADTLEIWVAKGIYKPTATMDRRISFALRNNITLYGGFSGYETRLSERQPMALTQPLNTTLSGDIGIENDPSDNSYHVFNNPGGLNSSAILDGFVITGGNAIDNVLNDTKRLGGGMLNNADNGYCNPAIRNCQFVNNAADLGGAIFNRAENKGACNPELINCYFLNNKALTAGGAIANSSFSSSVSNARITNCLFQSNSACMGGAMYNSGEYGTCNPQFVNCTFSNNRGSNGPTMYSSAYQGQSRATLQNCVIFNNPVNKGADFVNTFGSSTMLSYCLLSSGVTGYTGSSVIITTESSPFVSTTDLRLNASAPAIDTGNPSTTTIVSGPFSVSGIPLTDLANQPRITGSRVDIGAFEYQTQADLRIYSVQDGSWSIPATWSCNCLPVNSQQVVIRHRVSLPEGFEASCQSVLYEPGGGLLFNQNSRLRYRQ